jgi:hypothetical protein
MKRFVTRLFAVASDVWTLTALTCAALLVASAPRTQAGINVWTSDAPHGGNVLALAINPTARTTLFYIRAVRGGS